MRVLRRLTAELRRLSAYQITIYAANASFFLLLSLFPGMMLLIGLLQYTPLTPMQLADALNSVVPSALSPLVQYMTQELFAVNSVALLSVSAVIALWSASRGVYSLMRGLNTVYRVRETRNYFLLRLRCALYTVLLLLALLVTLGLHLFGQRLLVLAEQSQFPLASILVALLRMKFPLVVLLLTGLFALLFAVFPNRALRLRGTLPGAFSAAVAWVLFSALFSFYVNRFGNYSLYYGSLSIIALTMLWLYVCMCILFYGGFLNRLLAERRSGQPRKLC